MDDKKTNNNISTKKDWKDQLADLDKKCGWDIATSLKWEDEPTDDDEGHPNPKPRTPLREVLFFDDQDDNESAIIDEDDEEYYSAVENIDDLDEPILPFSWSRDWDHSGSRVHEKTSPSPETLVDDFELAPRAMEYIDHRLGPMVRYENRCWLVDVREKKTQERRELYAIYGTCLQQDACVLREYPQADMPGTEDVDKPTLTVTTPDGETLYPHDEREWPWWLSSGPGRT